MESRQITPNEVAIKPNENTIKMFDRDDGIISYDDVHVDADEDEDVAYEEYDEEYVEQLQKLYTWLCPIEEKIVPEDVPCSRTRRCLTKCIHSHALNITIIVMAVIDILILVTVLILEIEALKLPPGLKQDQLELARFGLECVSLSIIIIFTIEIGLKIFAVGLKEFCHHWIEILDTVVTIISLGTDILLIIVHIIKHNSEHHNNDDHNQKSHNDIVNIFGSAAGFLIIFRLWRIARIVNATLISITSVINQKMENMRRHEAHLKRHIIQLEQKLRNYHIHYAKYEEKTQQEFDDFQFPPPPQYHHHHHHKLGLHLHLNKHISDK